MFCGNCGKELENGKNFCSNCGSKLNEDNNINANNKNINNEIKTENKNQNSFADLLLIIVFSAIAFGVYSLVSYLLDLGLFENGKRVILWILMSISSGIGLFVAYKTGDTSGL